MLHISLVVSVILAALSSSTTAASQGTVHAVSKTKYTRAHSLDNSYQFDPRDGWEHVNVTNLQYKYARSYTPDSDQSSTPFEKRGRGKKKGSKNTQPQKQNNKGNGGSNIGGTVKHILGNVWNGLKALGQPEPVIITWYTGHDLLNPSCWTNGDWHPTDASFAAALTLEGWKTRPKCFKFLELCNTPKKCVFVRVVDTCAGCAKGSKHVDLTKAAFGELASFDEGTLSVQLRQATEPSGWFEDLWGPKHD